MSGIIWLSFCAPQFLYSTQKTLLGTTPTPLQIRNSWTFSQFAQGPSPFPNGDYMGMICDEETHLSGFESFEMVHDEEATSPSAQGQRCTYASEEIAQGEILHNN